MKLLPLQVVSFASLLSTAKAQALYDCSAGCSLDANLMGPPVCGQDNLTYLNECLAFCQNIPVVAFGVCEGEDPFQESTTSTDPQVIPLSTMTRFEDYRFVGKRPASTNMEEDMKYLYEQQIFTEEELDDGIIEEIGDVMVPNYRFTIEGYEYKTTTVVAEESAFFEAVAPELGLFGDDEDGSARKRNMVIIGQDSRNVVPSTKIFPFRTIGQADYFWGEGGCTLTMISRTSALTAGHCVWNTRTKTALNMTAFAPGRYRDVTKRDGSAEPFGTWAVDYVSMFGNFQQFGQSNFDMAVVTFKPRIRNDPNCRELFPGDAVGHVGLDVAIEVSGRVTDNRLPSMVVTGYPYDFLKGEMATSGLCAPEPVSRRANYINHYCDTVGGNSGSAVLVSGNIALGVHCHGIQAATGNMNGAPMMTSRLYPSIYEWAGYGNGSTLCSRTAEVQPSSVAQPVAPPNAAPVPAPVVRPSPVTPPVTEEAPVRRPTPLSIIWTTPVAQPRPVPVPVVRPTMEIVPAPLAQPVPLPAPIAVVPAPLAQPLPVPAPVVASPSTEILPTPTAQVQAPQPVWKPTPISTPVSVPTPEVIPTPVARPSSVIVQPVRPPTSQKYETRSSKSKKGKGRSSKSKKGKGKSGKGGKKRRLR